jgi:hypothetical protein
MLEVSKILQVGTLLFKEQVTEILVDVSTEG